MLTLILIVLGVVAIAVGAVLIYKNNQKAVDADVAKVANTVATVKSTVTTDVNDVKTDAATAEADVKKL